MPVSPNDVENPPKDVVFPPLFVGVSEVLGVVALSSSKNSNSPGGKQWKSLMVDRQ